MTAGMCREPLLSAAFSAWLPSLAAALFAAAGTARAQTNDNPFSALVGERREAAVESARPQAVERYVLTGDGRAFLFEERGATGRVQFLCSPEDMRIDCVLDGSVAPEIYLLSATRGPRGDVIYKNDDDDTLLRIAAYGGATVFWPGEAQGAAASKSFGDDSALTLEPRTYEDVLRRARNAEAQVSAVVGSAIVFDVGAGRHGDPADAAVLADAVLTAAKGVVTVADDPIGARVIADRVSRVAFLPGAQPGVALNGSVLEILYVPKQDIKGRPSSARVAHYLEDTL